MSMPIFLEVYREGELIDRVFADKKVVKIGRLASAHVTIDDDDVSRVHAVIEVSGPDEVFVIDMGSAKGTSVNGKKVTTKCRISEGDEITLGKIKIVVHTDQEKVSALAGGSREEEEQEEGHPQGEEQGEEAGEDSAAEDDYAEPAGGGEQVVGGEVKPEQDEEEPAQAGVGSRDAREPEERLDSIEGGEEAGESEQWRDEPEEEDLDEGRYEEDYEEGYHEDEYDEYEDYDPDTTLTEEDLEEIEDHRAGEVLQVKMFWENSLMGVEHLSPKKNHVITVGEDKKAHFYVPAEGEEDLWPLVKVESGEYILCIGKDMDGYVSRGGERTSVKTLVEERKARPSGEADGMYEYSMPADAMAHVSYGAVEFEISFVVPGKKIVVPWWTRIDWSLLQTFVLVAALETAILGLAFWYPPEAETLSLDLFSTPNRFVKFIIQPPKEKKKKSLKLGKKPGNRGNAGRYKGKEGRAGSKNKPIKKKKLSSEDIKKWLDATKRARDAKVARSKGILKILGNAGGSSGLSSVFGRSGLGGDIDRALGGLAGAGGSGMGHSDLGGYGGLGERGTGAGGGGTGDLIGLGRLGTAGRGGDGDGYGYGMGNLGRKGERGVSVETGQAIIMGALDRSIIKRVIRSHRAQIKYCYDRELVRTKGLFGKIVVQFTIQPSGRVSQASVVQTTMHNRNVENCVVNRIKGWRFPKPKGGGIVIVKYPFIFKTAGN